MWVDNIRLSGSRQQVEAASARLDATAKQYGISWKHADSFTAAERYDFIGIAFNHAEKQVAPAQKLLEKLAAEDLSNISAGGVEALVGRLVHASAICGLHIGAYYVPLKWARRIVNGLNAGRLDVAQAVVMPPSVRAQFCRWMADVRRPARVPHCTSAGAYTVFVDASLRGWGGVLVHRLTGRVTVCGAQWDPLWLGAHINELEAEALRLVVLQLPPDAAGGRVRVIVDNTTVRHVARKGVCLASQRLNDAVLAALAHLRTLGCACSLQWLRSAYNPADLPSRVPMSAVSGASLRQLEEQVTGFLLGRPLAVATAA